MDSISFYAHPEILSNISFHIDNYKDASIHISINCVRAKKFIRVVIGNKFCLMNDKKLTPEACDDLHFAIFEFNLQDKEYLCLLAMLDAIDISHWKRKYYSSQYAWAQWKLRISLKERKYISSAGTSGYPDAWDKFMQIWDTFTRLEALIALCRSRWTMDGTLTPLP